MRWSFWRGLRRRNPFSRSSGPPCVAAADPGFASMGSFWVDIRHFGKPLEWGQGGSNGAEPSVPSLPPEQFPPLQCLFPAFLLLKEINILGFFCSFLIPCVARAELEKGIPQFPASFFLFFYFFLFYHQKGIKKSLRGGRIIPFTTYSAQGQASSGGGYTVKNPIFPLLENHFSGVFPSFPVAAPWDGPAVLGTKVGQPQGDPSRAQGVGGGCRANIIRGER